MNDCIKLSGWRHDDAGGPWRRFAVAITISPAAARAINSALPSSASATGAKDLDTDAFGPLLAGGADAVATTCHSRVLSGEHDTVLTHVVVHLCEINPKLARPIAATPSVTSDGGSSGTATIGGSLTVATGGTSAGKYKGRRREPKRGTVAFLLTLPKATLDFRHATPAAVRGSFVWKPGEMVPAAIPMTVWSVFVAASGEAPGHGGATTSGSSSRMDEEDEAD